MVLQNGSLQKIKRYCRAVVTAKKPIVQAIPQKKKANKDSGQLALTVPVCHDSCDEPQAGNFVLLTLSTSHSCIILLAQVSGTQPTKGQLNFMEHSIQKLYKVDSNFLSFLQLQINILWPLFDRWECSEHGNAIYIEYLSSKTLNSNIGI